MADVQPQMTGSSTRFDERAAARALSANARKISDGFVTARGARKALPNYPGELPSSMEEAYAIQDYSIARWPDEVAGWKIGLVPEISRAAAGADRLAGPIFSKLVYIQKTDEQFEMPVFLNGFAAVEAEFIFKLGEDVDPKAPLTEDYLSRVAGELHVGAEIASSPFPGINDRGPLSVVSDFGNNYGLIVGPRVENWRDVDWSALKASVTIAGRKVGEATAADLYLTPLGALSFLIDLMRRRGIALRQGDYVSTGAATGVHDAAIGDDCVVDFGEFGRIDISLTEAR